MHSELFHKVISNATGCWLDDRNLILGRRVFSYRHHLLTGRTDTCPVGTETLSTGGKIVRRINQSLQPPFRVGVKTWCFTLLTHFFIARCRDFSSS